MNCRSKSRVQNGFIFGFIWVQKKCMGGVRFIRPLEGRNDPYPEPYFDLNLNPLKKTEKNMENSYNVWRNLKDFPLYQISESGIIRDAETHETINPFLSGVFWVVIISGKYRTVHRLVAKTFVPRKNKKRNKVMFLDGDRNNLHYSNLEWVTMKTLLKSHKQ